MTARRRAATTMTLLALLLIGVLAAMWHGDPSTTTTGFPDRPADVHESPRAVRAPAGGSRDYAFIQLQKGTPDPVTYDPCVPIHVVVDPRTMVRGGMRLLDQALEKVHDATGLRFTVDGLTHEPAPDAGTVTVDGGHGWLPVRVSWSDPATSKDLKGDVAGYAGSASIDHGGRTWFVTGTIVLDGPQLDEILLERHGWAAARSVVMHELGHLVGLDHVEAKGQLMQPEGSDSITSWGKGDLTGLAQLGHGSCINY